MEHIIIFLAGFIIGAAIGRITASIVIYLQCKIADKYTFSRDEVKEVEEK
jgi:hypothetical protein